MAELKQGLPIIAQYSDSLQLPSCKGEKQNDTEQKCHSAIEPLYFERSNFERSSDCISCI